MVLKVVLSAEVRLSNAARINKTLKMLVLKRKRLPTYVRNKLSASIIPRQMLTLLNIPTPINIARIRNLLRVWVRGEPE